MEARILPLPTPTSMPTGRPETAPSVRVDGARIVVEMIVDGVPLSGLVVLSDGADNSRRPIGDELLSLRAKSVPI